MLLSSRRTSRGLVRPKRPTVSNVRPVPVPAEAPLLTRRNGSLMDDTPHPSAETDRVFRGITNGLISSLTVYTGALALITLGFAILIMIGQNR